MTSPLPERFHVDGIAPLDIVAPSSEEELCQIVAAANSDGLGIIPYGGGTRIGLGNLPARPCLVLDMTNINRVVSHNYADLTASFQAGAAFGLVSEVLAQHGQFVPIDPPVPQRATIGGTLAASVSGPLKWHFGHPRDSIIGMKVIQPDGAVTKSGGKVVKNVSGYDMSRLHIGGLGSLGIILEASFKLTPLPMYEKTIIAAFRDVDDAMDASMSIFNSYVMPLSMLTFDHVAASRIELDRDNTAYWLAIRLGGRSRTLSRQVDEVATILRTAGATGVRDSDGPNSSLWRPLSDFGWSPDDAPLLNIKISSLPSHIRDILKFVDRLEHPQLESAVSAEPGFGTLEASWFGTGDVSHDTLLTIIDQMREYASRLGAAAIVQQCPTALKSEIDVWGESYTGIEVMRRMKSRYDPNGIMNPGRFVGRI